MTMLYNTSVVALYNMYNMVASRNDDILTAGSSRVYIVIAYVRST
jgi:hypothetical protein